MQGAGDYPLTIYLSLFGEIHYIDKIMSCYRVGSVNSWTQRVMKNDEKAIEHNNSAISALKKMNLYTNFKYNDAFKKQITYYKYQNILLHKSYWKIFTNISLFILFLKKCIPQIFKNKREKNFTSSLPHSYKYKPKKYKSPQDKSTNLRGDH